MCYGSFKVTGNGTIQYVIIIYTLSYQSAIVNIAVSCTIFEIFDVQEYRDPEI